MTLEIPKLSRPVNSLADLNAAFDGLNENALACFPWETPANKPAVNFKVAHNNESIFLSYRVQEDEVLARFSKHNSPVYTDSCVEFFVSFEGDKNYYNFEFNSLGTCLAAYGPDRHQRQSIAPETLGLIQTQTSLNRVQGQSHRFDWQLVIQLPISVLTNSKISSLSGLKARANFYKCGDDLTTPHYISWNNIGTSNPDFHQPPYFGEIEFL
ncbi:carbohydrate-binding family 9-like protein [uncultured Sunxiuqinia sp.]|uniref:carbohydrate-binding family 9-like protein n=1 Tax=uncultured Sunxiuqinia sp. TaxID=1573825 RepID=UPI002635A610|nr:carbohydrate-binding family 9-like protein [uncultured Sunxiuqinia sp.]